jgi:hypothetical protein
MEIKLPEYISISDYKKIVSLEHLTESEQMLARIAILTKNDINTVRGWTGDNIMNITNQITDLVNSTKPEFYPLIDTFKWKLKSRVKLALGKTEDLFKYYKIKPYDSDDRPIDADLFEEFPVKYLLGALFFFTLIKTEYLKNTLHSLTQNNEETNQMMDKEMETLLLSIGAGLAQFMALAKPISFQSQETNVLLT